MRDGSVASQGDMGWVAPKAVGTILIVAIEYVFGDKFSCCYCWRTPRCCAVFVSALLFAVMLGSYYSLFCELYSRLKSDDAGAVLECTGIARVAVAMRNEQVVIFMFDWRRLISRPAGPCANYLFWNSSECLPANHFLGSSAISASPCDQPSPADEAFPPVHHVHAVSSRLKLAAHCLQYLASHQPVCP